jgi:hypothetical protein
MDKKELIDTCRHHILDQLEGVRGQISDLKSSLESESKSTAGDKHDTGRAMIHLEMEKLGKQEQNLQKLLVLCGKITDSIKASAGLGSLVKTDKALFFLGVPLGKIKWSGQDVLCISLASPLGKLFFSKKEGEELVFQSTTYKILDVR